MSVRFSATPATSVRYRGIDGSDYAPQLWIEGDSGNFNVTAAPPRLSFWAAPFWKNNIRTIDDPSNLGTAIFNAGAAILGSDADYITAGAENLQRSFDAESGAPAPDRSIWEVLTGVVDVSDRDARLRYMDEDFDPNAITDKYLESKNNRQAVIAAKSIGKDLEGILRRARNRDHWMYLKNMTLTDVRERARLQAWEDQAGGMPEFITSVVGNMVIPILGDPTTAATLFIGAPAIQAAGRAGEGLILASREVLKVSAKGIGLNPALRAPALRLAGAALKAPAAAHSGLAAVMGHRLALAVEGGAFGAAFDTGSQVARMKQSEIMFDDPKYQQHWSWAELGLVTGLSAALTFGLSGKAARDMKALQRGSVDAVGALSHSSPIAQSWDYIRAQGRLDSSIVRAQRAATTLLGDGLDSVASYMDDTILAEAGLHRFQMADAFENLVTLTDGQPLPKEAVQQHLAGVLQAARKARKLSDTAEATFTSRMEQEAVAAATGRAARSLPESASNEEVYKAAMELVPEELEKIEARLMSGSSLAKPAREGELELWKAEAAAIERAASQRALTPYEIKDMARIAGKLESLGEPNPFQGMATKLKKRYQDGSLFNPFRVVPESPIGKALENIRKAIQAQEDAGDLASFGRAANSLRRARKALQEESAKVQPKRTSTITQVRQKWQENPPKTDADFFKALDEISNTEDFDANALLEDGSLIRSILSLWDLGSLVRKLANSGTGLEESLRNPLGVLREIAHEMDSSKLRVGDLDPRGATHRTMEQLRNDLNVSMSELLEQGKKLSDSGKFGRGLRPLNHIRKKAAFEKAVSRHLMGLKSTDPDVVHMADLARGILDKIADAGENLDDFVREKNFAPRRYQLGAVYKNPSRFQSVLSGLLNQRWQKSKEVHLDTLVEMGLAEKHSVPGSTAHRWTIEGQTVPENMSRAQLKQFNIDEAQYLEALPAAMQEEAHQIRRNLTGTDSYTISSDGGVHVKSPKKGLTQQTIKAEAELFLHPEMEEFIDWGFFSNMHSYLHATGMRILNTERHSARWGIPGLTMDRTLRWIERNIPSNLLPEDARKVRAGLGSLREKVQLAEGRLPTTIDHTNRFGHFMADVGSATAGALYGGTIGQAILSTEISQSLFSKIHSPSNIITRVGQVFKAAVPVSERHRVTQAFGIGISEYRSQSMARLTGSSTYGQGFQFSFVPKLLGAFLDAFNPASKGAPGQGSRVAAGIRAFGGASMALGQMDYFTQMARHIHIRSSLDEVGHFFNAAEKMAEKMKTVDLNAIASDAEAAALSAGKSAEQATKAGQQARLKKWKGIARESGFGSQWNVAAQMARVNLLNGERLAALRKAGIATSSLKTTGPFKTLDYLEMMKYAADTVEEQALFDEAARSLRDMVIETMNKRISQQSIMQTPTSPASRSWYGQLMLTMTSFGRSWFDNNVLDAAQIPLHNFAGLMSIHLMGETINRFLRSIERGQSPEDILEDILEDPDNFLARSLTNVPFAGAATGLFRGIGEAFTRDAPTGGPRVFRSAGTGSIESALSLVQETVNSASPLAGGEDISARSWRTAAKLTPAWNAWWAGLARVGLNAATGIDLRAGSKPNPRGGNGHPVLIPEVTPFHTGPIETVSAPDEDIPFTLPLE